MTAALVPALDLEQQAVVDAYRTSELATVTRDGTPIAWPTAARYDWCRARSP